MMQHRAGTRMHLPSTAHASGAMPVVSSAAAEPGERSASTNGVALSSGIAVGSGSNA